MIEIFNYRPIGKGSMVGSFSIRVKKWKDFCIHGLVLFDTGNKHWLTFPSNKVEKNGETKFYPYCGFSDKDLNESFKSEIMKYLQEHLRTQTGV